MASLQALLSMFKKNSKEEGAKIAEALKSIPNQKHRYYKINNGDLILYHLANRYLLEELIEEKGRLEYRNHPILLTPNKLETLNSLTTEIVYNKNTNLCLIEAPISKIRTIPQDYRRIIPSRSFPYVSLVAASYLENDMFEISRDNFSD